MAICETKMKITFRDIGVIGTTICTKPVYADGLCKHHYTRKLIKESRDAMKALSKISKK
jgi:hypothetical protein